MSSATPTLPNSHKRAVDFYLGHSRKKIQRANYLGGQDASGHKQDFRHSNRSCSSTDFESDFDGHTSSSSSSCCGSYSALQRLPGCSSASSAAIDISSSSNQTSHSTHSRAAISLVTPPHDDSAKYGLSNNSSSQPTIKSILDKATSISPAGEISYSCQSIAILTKAISQRSLPPSPPRSFGLSSLAPSRPATSELGPEPETAKETEREKDSSTLGLSAACPFPVLSQLAGIGTAGDLHYSRITPRGPTGNTLIPINLDPVSPMLLATDILDNDLDAEDLDCALLSDDDEQHPRVSESSRHQEQPPAQVFDLDDRTDEFTVSPEFLVGYEQDIISQLNLEEDLRIVDKFRTRPLLADGNRPFIPCSPVFATVDELLRVQYSDVLRKGSREYLWHLGRLERNREKLKALSLCIEGYEQARQQRLLSMQKTKSSGGREDGRFRVRR